jgi:hypothetical protein
MRFLSMVILLDCSLLTPRSPRKFEREPGSMIKGLGLDSPEDAVPYFKKPRATPAG